jgi:hypothetical protein
VRFSANGTNAAKVTTATFDRIGTYQYQLTVTDAQGNATRSPVLQFEVWPVVSALALTPAAPTVMNGAAVALIVEPLDQFGDVVTLNAGPWGFYVDGPGFVDLGNRYHAPQVGTGPVTLRVSNGTLTGTATVTVVDRPSDTAVDYSGGFETSPGLVLNGAAVRDAAWLRLTRADANVAGSAFTTTPVNVTGFVSRFALLMPRFPAVGTKQPSGMAFVLQGAGPTAVGAAGSGAGYRGIPNSVALVFQRETNSIALAINGAAPTQSVNLDNTGIILGEPSSLTPELVYDGATLTVAFAGRTFRWQFPVDIPGVLGTTTAYVGFTAGSGPTADQYGSQDVLNWSYRAIPPGAPDRPPVIVRPAQAVSTSPNGRTATLQARVEDDGGPDNLRTRWEWVFTPPEPAPHLFNGSRTAAAVFDEPGTYTFRFIATDIHGQTATSDVTYVVT